MTIYLLGVSSPKKANILASVGKSQLKLNSKSIIDFFPQSPLVELFDLCDKLHMKGRDERC